MSSRVEPTSPALVIAATLATAGLLACAVASGSELAKVLGGAVGLTLVLIMSSKASSRGLFLGALVSSAGLAFVALRLLQSWASGSRRTPGAVGVAIGLLVAASWLARDSRRGRLFMLVGIILAGTLGSFLLVVAAHSVVLATHSLNGHCLNAVTDPLLQGGASLLCVSLIVLVVTCCWGRWRPG